MQRHIQRKQLAAAPPGKPTYEKTSPTAGAGAQKKPKSKKRPPKSMPGVERLFKDASARKAKMEQRRQSYEAQNTFTPKITKLGRLSVSPPGANASGSQSALNKDDTTADAGGEKSEETKTRSEQLYADAKARAARHAKRIKDVQATEAPFKPTLSKVSARRVSAGSKKRQPLFSPDVLEKRDKARAELKAKLLAEETEKIEKTRVKRTPYQSKRKQGTNSVVARMEAAAARSKARKERLKLEQLAKENETCSFQPNTNKSSKSSGKTKNGVNTFDRLYGGAKVQRERRENARKKRLEDEKPSFRPKIREKDGTLRLAKSKIDNSAWIKRQVKEGTEKLKFKKTAPTYKQTYEERELSAQMEELTFKPLITSPLTSPDADDSRPDGVDADAIPLRLDTAAEGAASPPAAATTTVDAASPAAVAAQ